MPIITPAQTMISFMPSREYPYVLALKQALLETRASNNEAWFRLDRLVCQTVPEPHHRPSLTISTPNAPCPTQIDQAVPEQDLMTLASFSRLIRASTIFLWVGLERAIHHSSSNEGPIVPNLQIRKALEYTVM